LTTEADEELTGLVYGATDIPWKAMCAYHRPRFGCAWFIVFVILNILSVRLMNATIRFSIGFIRIIAGRQRRADPGAGISHNPPPVSEQVVLFQLHAGIWWGAILLALGTFWSFRYKPRAPCSLSKWRFRSRTRSHARIEATPSTLDSETHFALRSDHAVDRLRAERFVCAIAAG